MASASGVARTAIGSPFMRAPPPAAASYVSPSPGAWQTPTTTVRSTTRPTSVAQSGMPTM